MKSIKALFGEWKSDYRHFICIAITLISLGLGFLFPNSLPRLAETVRDLGLSIAYYFCELFLSDGSLIRPSVTKNPTWKLAESIWKPIELFPFTWEEFKVLWKQFWEIAFSEENFRAYIENLGNLMLFLSRLLVIVIPLILVLILRFQMSADKRSTDRNKKSTPLKAYERFVFRVVYPFITWCKDLVSFCKQNDSYWKFWLFLWMLHFNIFAILVAFFSYYFYFSASWDVISLYTQFLKLIHDLTPMLRFLPTIIWLMLGIRFYNHICRSLAFARLYYGEHCNRSFLSRRGIVTTVYGEMGIGKTQLVTSMALSSEVAQFDDAFDILLEMDMKFPNFPWQRLRDELRKRIDRREIVDLPSCKAWIQRSRVFFDRIASLYTAQEYQAKRKQYRLLREDYTFGYDYTHYRTTYNDELKITHLYEALQDYACAYLIFTVKTTLLFSNYSIRVDSILSDLGNMPHRDSDFLNRSPEYQEAYSHHAHIIDIDMLRLGKKIVKGNPKARRLSFGTFVITEIDKEFKNALVLKEVKVNTEETNQKNDLHDACLMMCRHAAVVANRVFIRIICDLQRPEAWGAGGRELGEVIYIEDKNEISPTLPFFSPYWLCQGVFLGIKSRWNSFYARYIENRCDQTLIVYLFKNIIAALNNHYDKIDGGFGMQTLKLELQSGRLDGKKKKAKWRLIMKKDRSRRYKTACLEAVFDSYEPNTMHIDDFIMYAGEVGTDRENQLQNSYFQNDIRRMRELNMLQDIV